MIYKLCRRCKIPIEHPLTYCSTCHELYEERQIELQQERDRKYNKKRDPKYKQFYNSNDWRTLKEKKLQDEQYRCERCKKLAVEVHHIKYIQTLIIVKFIKQSDIFKISHKLKILTL